MTKIPFSVGDSDEKREYPHAWPDALEWAKRGDRRLLVELLRSDQSLPDNTELRAFLADVVELAQHSGPGKPPTRPELLLHVNAGGGVTLTNDRDIKRLEIKKWIEENRAAFGKRVFEAAAEHFGIDESALHNLIRRGRRKR